MRQVCHTEGWRNRFTVHSLAQTSEEAVSMAPSFLNGDIGVPVFCSATVLEKGRDSAAECQEKLKPRAVPRATFPESVCQAIS